MSTKDYTNYPPDLQPAKDLLGFIVEGPNHLNAKSVIKGVVIGYDTRPTQGGADHVYLTVIPQGMFDSLANRRYIRVQDVTWSSPHKVFDAPDTYPTIEAQKIQAIPPSPNNQAYQEFQQELANQFNQNLGIPSEILSPESQKETEGDTPQP